MYAGRHWWKAAVVAAGLGLVTAVVPFTPNVVAASDGDATISGIVVDRATHAPLQGICVAARGNSSADATTAVDGTYELHVPPPSETTSTTGSSPDAGRSVVVLFSDCATHHYASQYFDDATTSADATWLAIDAGQQHTGIDAALDVGGTISGQVRGGGAPVEGVCAIVMRGVGSSLDALPGGPSTVGSTTTAGDGTWTVGGLSTGRYRVAFHDCRARAEYLDQWYDHAADAVGAALVDVTVGRDTPGIDADLQRGGAITGRVTDPDGNPAADVCVSTSGGTNAHVDSNGDYRLAPLTTGSYAVHFASCGPDVRYLAENYDNQQYDATPVTVTVGQTTSGIDASLAWATTLSGTVRTTDGAALGGACVGATTDGARLQTVTAPDGTWSISGLPAGSIIVDVQSCASDTYAPRWYRDGRSLAEATPVVAPRGGSISGIDIALPVGGVITGRVTDTTGTPIVGACVAATGPLLRQTSTGADGSYRLVGLLTGSYNVEFRGCDAAGQAFSTTRVVDVAEGEIRDGVDAALVYGAMITGRVTDASGRPMPFVCVGATSPSGGTSTFTDSSGRYKLFWLHPGSYTVAFSDCLHWYDVVDEWWQDAPERAAATPIVLHERQTVTAVDAVLDRSSTIRGAVRYDDYSSVVNACVHVVGPAPSTTTHDSVVTAGSWAVTRLRSGRYLVHYTPCGDSTILDEWHRDGTSAADADVVDVGPGQTASVEDAVSNGESPAPFALMGIKSIVIGTGTTVTSGDVGTHGRRRDAQPEIKFGDGVVVHDRVIGDTVAFGTGDVVGQIRDNEQTGAPAAVLCCGWYVSVPLLRLPTHRAAEPGPTDVMIAAGVAEISSGHYRDLVVEPGATLRLTGGRYDARSVTVKPGGQLLFRLPSELRVATTVEVGAAAFVGPGPLSGLGARNFRLDVDGTGVTIGDGAHVAATVDAPGASLTTGTNVDLVGGYLAATITIGAGNHVRWWSGFADDPT